VGARAPGRRPCRRISTLYAVILKRVSSINLDQGMLKHAYFLKKCNNRLSVGDPPLNPRLPLAAGEPTPIPLRCDFCLL